MCLIIPQIENLPDGALDLILQHVAAPQPPNSRSDIFPDFALWRTLASVDFIRRVTLLAWPPFSNAATVDCLHVLHTDHCTSCILKTDGTARQVCLVQEGYRAWGTEACIPALIQMARGHEEAPSQADAAV